VPIKDYTYFLQKPPYEKLRKKDQVDKEKQSKDTFMVYEVASDTLVDPIHRAKKHTSSDKRKDFLIVEKHKDLSLKITKALRL
jgi:hypothetical protein